MSNFQTNENEQFDFKAHRYATSKWFEDFNVGDKYCLPSRTQTEAVFAAFMVASGDHHPIHYDRKYCKDRGHRDLLAHGLQTMCQTAPGAGLWPEEVGDSLKGALEFTGKALKPVYCGDTLYPQLEIIELRPGKTTGVIVFRSTIHNQDGVLVFEGTQNYLVRKNPVNLP